MLWSPVRAPVSTGTRADVVLDAGLLAPGLVPDYSRRNLHEPAHIDRGCRPRPAVGRFHACARRGGAGRSDDLGPSLQPGADPLRAGRDTALHDALVKPMPEKTMAPSLAESWSTSPDGLVYEFVLRKGATFHNGEAVTADDVKFSFERYRGISAKALKEEVAAVETPDPRRVRFRLKQPWPDFMAFYGTPATGAAWIVPRKYVEKVGEDGFKKAPVGAGPYKFVSFTPGV